VPIDLGAGAPRHCLLLWGIGLVPSTALWLLAFGATAVHRTPWLFFRIDLHARAAAAVRRDLAIATALHAGLISLVLLLWIVLALLPIGFLAAALGGAATLYAVVVSAHLSGAVFRRNPEVLERIYRGRNEPAPELAGRRAGPRVQERTRRTP
jgi:hypothetical protein